LHNTVIDTSQSQSVRKLPHKGSVINLLADGSFKKKLAL